MKLLRNTILLSFILFAFGVLYSGCKKEEPAIPVVTTKGVTRITPISATFTGNITVPWETSGPMPYDVLSRGFCWSVNPNPIFSDNRINIRGVFNDSDFSGTVTSLGANTTYYFRTYALYENGIIYGDIVNFTTSAFENILYNSGTFNQIQDIEGNVYNTAQIGSQEWMIDNLKTKKYSNGIDIPNVTENSAWSNLTTAAYCNYNNVSSNSLFLGCLYNWEAVSNSANICPTGWHVPTDNDWKILELSLGMLQFEIDTCDWRGINMGTKLKEQETNHWLTSSSINIGVNSSGFTAIPSGCRDIQGICALYGIMSDFWTSTQNNGETAWSRSLGYDKSSIKRNADNKKLGYSVRCVKN